MEDSPLNLAHFHGRRAENHLIHRRYAKAIENYEKAAVFTEEALKTVSSPIAMKSLTLQVMDYKRQLNLINLKKATFEKYFKELERHRGAARKQSPNSTWWPGVATTLHSASAPSISSAEIVYSDSILESELLASEIPHLAPLELPPQLDFESFRYKKSHDIDL